VTRFKRKITEHKPFTISRRTDNGTDVSHLQRTHVTVTLLLCTVAARSSRATARSL